MRLGKRMIFIIMSICCVLSLVACDKKEEVDEVQVVYEYGDSVVTYGEFYIMQRRWKRIIARRMGMEYGAWSCLQTKGKAA